MREGKKYFMAMSQLRSSPPFQGGDRGGSNRAGFSNPTTKHTWIFQSMDYQLLAGIKLIEGFTFIQLKDQVKEVLKKR